MLSLILTLLMLQASTVLSIIAYDCGAKEINVTTISLLDVGDCDIPSEKIESEEKKIQLLQVVAYHEVEIIQCKMVITRTI